MSVKEEGWADFVKLCFEMERLFYALVHFNSKIEVCAFKFSKSTKLQKFSINMFEDISCLCLSGLMIIKQI